MAKIDWGYNIYHWCRITNPDKKHYGETIRLKRGIEYGTFFMSEFDTDEPDYCWHTEDFVVTDANEVDVNIDETYWKELYVNTAKDIMLSLIGSNYESTSKTYYVTQASRLAMNLVNELKSNIGKI